MRLIELRKADTGGTFWLAIERIVSLEETDSYGVRTRIQTDDGSKFVTGEAASTVAARINTKARES